MACADPLFMFPVILSQQKRVAEASNRSNGGQQSNLLLVSNWIKEKIAKIPTAQEWQKQRITQIIKKISKKHESNLKQDQGINKEK